MARWQPTAEQKLQYETAGYFILRNLISADLAAELRGVIRNVIMLPEPGIFVDKEVLCGQQTTFRGKIYGTHTRDGNMNVFPQRCVRDERYKYILNLMPENRWTTHFTRVEGIPESHAEVWNSWVEKAKSDAKTAQLVYLTQHHPVEELYDVKADPYEFNNLAFEAASRPILEKMRADVRQWMQSQGDKGEFEYEK